ncbi:TetR/AcrR family transcriptional regulator [Klenkia taihuensis]|uniref:Transcriptional regulator, TetR family n=1 Tax=Klenkia taihuensis TaxID=1225127 RepID=A0A1I1P7Y5_9ACTN|nr:TetR family transcriptional regulator [Klenkia taihuensis]GHE11504.1 TetR family transcriptional regulator [Klenkia taihuensis]SFD03788.1 transcriptional regulator, TetR family [Klenkia taihuensis]
MTTPKGEARREAIVAAAARLVAEAGPDAVAHRAVAAAAGVPLAATTYYFRDLDDLLVAATARVGEQETAAATALVAALPAGRRTTRATAAVLVDVLLGAGRRTDEQLQAYYERWLAGGRHPALRPVLAATRARTDALLVEVLARGGHREVPVARLVALADGTALSALVEGDGGARAATEQAVAELLSRRRRW